MQEARRPEALRQQANRKGEEAGAEKTDQQDGTKDASTKQFCKKGREASRAFATARRVPRLFAVASRLVEALGWFMCLTCLLPSTTAPRPWQQTRGRNSRDSRLMNLGRMKHCWNALVSFALCLQKLQGSNLSATSRSGHLRPTFQQSLGTEFCLTLNNPQCGHQVQ